MLSTISEMDPVLIAAAVIPAVILLLQVYRADRLEKEPTGSRSYRWITFPYLSPSTCTSI